MSSASSTRRSRDYSRPKFEPSRVRNNCYSSERASKREALPAYDIVDTRDGDVRRRHAMPLVAAVRPTVWLHLITATARLAQGRRWSVPRLSSAPLPSFVGLQQKPALYTVDVGDRRRRALQLKGFKPLAGARHAHRRHSIHEAGLWKASGPRKEPRRDETREMGRRRRLLAATRPRDSVFVELAVSDCTYC